MPDKITDGRKKRAHLNKKAILSAARDIFINNGFNKNSMMDISRKAGVGYGTLYTHFSGRDDILKHLLNEIVADFDRLVSRSYEPASISEVEKRIREEIHYLLKLAIKHRDILRVAYEAMGQSVTIAEYWQKLFRRYVDKSFNDYSYSQSKGFARSDPNPNYVARSSVYLIKEFFWDVVMERDEDIDKISNHLTSYIMFGTYHHQ